MIKTSDVFTPAKLPTVTDVDRSSVSADLKKWVRRGGFFTIVLGTTKLGKTTMVKGFLASQSLNTWSTYISGQSLQAGARDLWLRLAKDLAIPTSRETGLANSDKTTWGVLGRIAAKLPAFSAEAGASVGGSQESRVSAGEKFDIDPESAVTQALGLLRDDGQDVVIAIDDFHFVTDEDARRGIALALRPLTDRGCSVVLSTIPGGQRDSAMSGTQLGGRRKSVHVPKWTEDELAQIANKGFQALSVTTNEDVIRKLAEESFGSPQIMQQLCLDLCEEVNEVYEGDAGLSIKELDEPSSWDQFFVDLEDDDAAEWVAKLSAGPNPRKARKKRQHPGPPPRDLDGYQLIMLTLNELGAPSETSLTDIKQRIGQRLELSGTELNQLALEQKARNMGLLASKDMRVALQASTPANGVEDNDDEQADEDEAAAAFIAAEAVPQPVFEVSGDQQYAVVRMLDPLVAYTLKWHPEIVQAARAYFSTN